MKFHQLLPDSLHLRLQTTGNLIHQLRYESRCYSYAPVYASNYHDYIAHKRCWTCYSPQCLVRPSWACLVLARSLCYISKKGSPIWKWSLHYSSQLFSLFLEREPRGLHISTQIPQSKRWVTMTSVRCKFLAESGISYVEFCGSFCCIEDATIPA